MGLARVLGRAVARAPTSWTLALHVCSKTLRPPAVADREGPCRVTGTARALSARPTR